jgi:hypothetical protein
MSNPPDQKRSPLEINEPDTGATPPGIGWAVDDDNAKLQLLALQMLSDLPDAEVMTLPVELAGLIPPEAKHVETVLAKAIATFRRDHLLFINLKRLKTKMIKFDQTVQQAIDVLSVLPGTEATVAHLHGEQDKWRTFLELMGQNKAKPLLVLPRRLLVAELASIYTTLTMLKTGKPIRLTNADFKYSRKYCSDFVSFLLSVFGSLKELTLITDVSSDDRIRAFKKDLKRFWLDYQKQLQQVDSDFQEHKELGSSL